METLVIDRKRWGTGAQGGSLRDSHTGKQCCLGFYCEAKGCKRIRDFGLPDALSEVSLAKIPVLLNTKHQNNAITMCLSKVNDSQSRAYILHPERRERRIQTLFRKLGVLVKFIN